MEEKVWEKLKEVIDPELGINVVELGLIYEVKVEDKTVKITMTLTTPFCPLAGHLVEQVKRKVEELGVKADVELTFDPPWTPDRIKSSLKNSKD